MKKNVGIITLVFGILCSSLLFFPFVTVVHSCSGGFSRIGFLVITPMTYNAFAVIANVPMALIPFNGIQSIWFSILGLLCLAAILCAFGLIAIGIILLKSPKTLSVKFYIVFIFIASSIVLVMGLFSLFTFTGWRMLSISTNVGAILFTLIGFIGLILVIIFAIRKDEFQNISP